MNVASAFAGLSLDEIKAALDGGTLTIYSVARPLTADHAVDRSSVLATFTFASPAFAEPQDGYEVPFSLTLRSLEHMMERPGSPARRRPTAQSSPIFPPAPAHAKSNSLKFRFPQARR